MLARGAGGVSLAGCRRVSTHAGASDSLLHRSILRTDFFQDSMLRLPIPKLPDTLRKYLYFLEPLVPPDRLAAAKAAVAAFGGPSGAGPRLQEALVADDAANPGTSYISALWFDMYCRAGGRGAGRAAGRLCCVVYGHGGRGGLTLHTFFLHPAQCATGRPCRST